MLKELCPAMFEGDVLPPEFSSLGRSGSYNNLASATYTEVLANGKISPTSVVDGSQDSPRPRRKRSRAAAEDAVDPAAAMDASSSS